ncbi:MAG: VWA domain-containing protein [Chloroflexota bacterium]
MSFGAPGYLALLLLAAASAGIIAWWLRWRARARARFGVPRTRTAAAYLAPAVLVAALAIVAGAAARPRFGSREVLVEQRGVDLAIVLDVSNSMLADDAQPTRLGQAQGEIGALLDRMQGDRVGLVIFARQPFIRSPLTADLQALQGIVKGVDRERGLVPPGSDLGAAVRGAQRLLESDQAATKAMLIVSDGEDRGAGVAGAVADAHSAGIRVYAAGAGTAQGAPVRDVDSSTGLPRVRIDSEGRPVVTRLDEAALRGIADAGGGRYIALSGGGAPLTGLAAELRGLTQTAFGTKQSSEPIERFQIFVVIALLLLAGELALPVLRRPRAMLRPAARLWPLAGAGLLVGAICSTTVADSNRHGNNEYARGNFDAAIAQYRTAEAKAPSLGELRHNAGNAYDRNGQYDEAIAETKRALPARRDLVSRIEYALGNHYAGATRLSDALDAYKRALLADPADADAKHNLEVVAARLTPALAPTSRPPEQPTPGPNATFEPGATPGAGQPGGTPAASQTGTGGGQATPGAGDGALTKEQLERALAEALAGKDKQFTEDEALRVLDLLDEANRRAIEDVGNAAAGAATLPDY